MMVDAILELVEHGLSQFFKRFPRESLVDLRELFPEVLPVFEQDVQSKFPRFSEPLSDGSRLAELITLDAGLEATLLYRIEHSLYLRDPSNPLLGFLANLMRLQTGTEIYYSTEIGPGLNVQHGSGIVVGPRNKIGRNFMLHQGVTIGQSDVHRPGENCLIGDDVVLFAGSKLLGALTLGDRVKVGANAVLLQDAEPDSVYVGAPARRVA